METEIICCGGKNVPRPTVLLLESSVATIVETVLVTFSTWSSCQKKCQTQTPYFYPRVKLPICNFHYNLALKNDFYHLRREIFFFFSPSLLSLPLALSFWRHAVWWNVVSSIFLCVCLPLLRFAHFSWWSMNERLCVWVVSPVLPFGLAQIVQRDMRFVTEDFSLPPV